MKAKERKPHPKYPVEVIVEDRKTPICKDNYCDPSEEPNHWVDIELCEPYKSAPELMVTIDRLASILEDIMVHHSSRMIQADQVVRNGEIRAARALLRRAGKGNV